MLEIVQLPLARRLWRISKLFHLPINDPRIQQLDTYDLDFYELSAIADDPKALEQYQNHFQDDEFEDWLEEFDLEQAAKKSSAAETTSQELDMPDSETIDWSEKNRQPALPMEEYEEPTDQDSDISDWEEVSD